MKVLIAGDSATAGRLAKALGEADLTVRLHSEEPPPSGPPDDVERLARDLRGMELELGERGHDALLVCSDSNAALAGVLMATKAGVPVARVEAPGTASEGSNGRLIDRLADASLAAEPDAILSWLRSTYTPVA